MKCVNRSVLIFAISLVLGTCGVNADPAAAEDSAEQQLTKLLRDMVNRITPYLLDSEGLVLENIEGGYEENGINVNFTTGDLQVAGIDNFEIDNLYISVLNTAASVTVRFPLITLTGDHYSLNGDAFILYPVSGAGFMNATFEDVKLTLGLTYLNLEFENNKTIILINEMSIDYSVSNIQVYLANSTVFLNEFLNENAIRMVEESKISLKNETQELLNDARTVLNGILIQLPFGGDDDEAQNSMSADNSELIRQIQEFCKEAISPYMPEVMELGAYGDVYEDSDMRLAFNSSDMRLTGATNYKLELSISEEKSKTSSSVTIHFPRLEVTGDDYRLSGEVLRLYPVSGSGLMKITFHDLKVTFGMVINGTDSIKTVRVETINFDFSVSGVHVFLQDSTWPINDLLNEKAMNVVRVLREKILLVYEDLLIDTKEEVNKRLIEIGSVYSKIEAQMVLTFIDEYLGKLYSKTISEYLSSEVVAMEALGGLYEGYGINITYSTGDLQLTGVNDFVIVQSSVLMNNLTASVTVQFPRLSLTGDYDITGEAYAVFPTEGSGFGNVTFHNVSVTLNITLDSVKPVDGHSEAHIEDISIDFSVNDLEVNLANSSWPINDVLNENGKEILYEYRDVIVLDIKTYLRNHMDIINTEVTKMMTVFHYILLATTKGLF